MPMYVSIDDQHLRIKRGDTHPGGRFEEIPGQNAKEVFEMAWAAKQDNPDTHGYIYDVLKRGGKSLKIRVSNAYASALMFAATAEPMPVASGVDDLELDLAWDEADAYNEEWNLLYRG